MNIITIREQPNNTQNEYKVTVTFNNNDEFPPCTITNPFTTVQEADLKWYFDEYVANADDEQKSNQVKDDLKKQGIELFEQIFKSDFELYARYREAQKQQTHDTKLFIEITGSPAFHSLHWETLYDAVDSQWLALDIPLIRKYTTPTKVELLESSPTINLLMVTARPNRERDINYRAISRHLVESLRQAKLRVNIEMLRPGTRSALKKHLATQKKGHYHIIHLDVHGKLRDNTPLIYLESEQPNHVDLIEAAELAELFYQYRIPIVILNACESGKQVLSAFETSLSGQLMGAGIPLVLAMCYTVTVRAASLFMGALYQHLFDKCDDDVVNAIQRARQNLYDNKKRFDAYHQEFELEDWIIPVVYQNTQKVSLPLRDFTPEEQAVYYAHKPHYDPNLPYDQFMGRDWEIYHIEAKLRQHNILLIRGGSGIGKTALLHYLGRWWQATHFINEVFYFGYDAQTWTQQQILEGVIQKFNAEMRGTFESLELEKQLAMVIDYLLKTPNLLIFDALSYIESQEKPALHDLLAQLVGGKTLILLGSQQNEKWLSSGTFAENSYPLSGLDSQSAFMLMKRQLTHHDDKAFYNLSQNVEQHPLLLKIMTRAMLENQTAMLSTLQAEMTRMDIQGEAKQQSILQAAIHFIYNTLAPDEQELLLCLAPLKFAININALPEYSQRLRQQAVLAHLAFDNWENVLENVADWGLLRLYPDVLLQSAFVDFLRSRLGEKASLQGAIEMAFVQYHEHVSKQHSVTPPETNKKDDSGFSFLTDDEEWDEPKSDEEETNTKKLKEFQKDIYKTFDELGIHSLSHYKTLDEHARIWLDREIINKMTGLGGSPNELLELNHVNTRFPKNLLKKEVRQTGQEPWDILHRKTAVYSDHSLICIPSIRMPADQQPNRAVENPTLDEKTINLLLQHRSLIEIGKMSIVPEVVKIVKLGDIKEKCSFNILHLDTVAVDLSDPVVKGFFLQSGKMFKREGTMVFKSPNGEGLPLDQIWDFIDRYPKEYEYFQTHLKNSMTSIHPEDDTQALRYALRAVDEGIQELEAKYQSAKRQSSRFTLRAAGSGALAVVLYTAAGIDVASLVAAAFAGSSLSSLVSFIPGSETIPDDIRQSPFFIPWMIHHKSQS